MKTFVPMVLGITALISACASAPAPDQHALNNERDYDMRTVNAVNRVAHDNGLEVHWINYPSVRPTTASNEIPALGEPSGT